MQEWSWAMNYYESALQVAMHPEDIAKNNDLGKVNFWEISAIFWKICRK